MFSNFFETQESTPETSESLFEIIAEEDRKKFICKYQGCGKFFRYKSEIIRHIATHSESRPFVCHYDNCFKSFKRNDALENHVRSSHTKETPFVCPFPDCGMKFTTHGSFRYHVLKHNKQLPEGETFASNQEEVYDPSLQRKQVKLNSPSDNFVSFDQEPLKMGLSSKKFAGIDESDEFFVPPPRFAGKIQWEMVNDETETSTPAPKNEDPKEDKLQFILEENKLLKQKLITSEKMIKSMQKQIDDLLYSLFERQSQPDDMPSNLRLPSLPKMDSQIINFMDANERSEDPFFNMMTYTENNNGSNMQVGPTYSNENNSADIFLSFDREIETFDF
jgi:hypothetical protein